MKKQVSQDRVWLGFDIKTVPGPILRPTQIHFWNGDDFKKAQPEAPFHYFADALTGLALVHLNPHLKNPFSAPQMSFPFCHEAWLALEPHRELFDRSQIRVQSLREHMKEIPAPLTEYFERNITDVLESSLHPWGIDLEHLGHVVEAIDYLESKMGTPLLYNFNLKFSKSLVEKLHYLHSMLFNLRSMIALDYNAHIQDPTHEACKVDSITDYLSKAEYVANDALLFHHFRKQKDHMKADAYQSLEKSFRTLSHNGYCLIEAMPKSFLNSLTTHELEETLYIVQMDWLLGTDSGLLFRIREELYGLVEGYEKVFWSEADGRADQTQTCLSVSCELTADQLYPTTKAA
ncbi:MAG: hypothetical protein COT73_07420 [Bdellovibrio sp. CG10_big_fil_rev_8_21_14_0_10_47_8]|nr:MAG: hypothetical protein COT73_07420 [Bdellovibrio sp. CG10_big_fil_rev_8_21_14_0_10_47_8]